MRFGRVPLDAGRVYWFATRDAAEGERAPGGGKAELLRLFGGWHDPIPALLAAGISELPSALDGVDPGPVVVGIAVSFLVGYASIAWLLRLVATRSIVFFVPYRVALGVVVLAAVALS